MYISIDKYNIKLIFYLFFNIKTIYIFYYKQLFKFELKI